MTVKYIGKNTCGFVHNHKYEITITQPPRMNGLLIKAFYDDTKSEEVELQIVLSNETSVKRYFDIDKVEIDNS